MNFHASTLAVVKERNESADLVGQHPENPRQSPLSLEVFFQNYCQNKLGVDALRSVVIKPPISEARELPPDTDELLERAKIILRLREAACERRWTRESVDKQVQANKEMNPRVTVDTSHSIPAPIKAQRSPNLRMDNFSMKKRRQSLMRENIPDTVQGRIVSSKTDLFLVSEKEEEEESGDEQVGFEEKKLEDSVESVIDLWYNTIPDPDLNVGSYEIQTLAAALQNRLIGDLIHSCVIRPLSKYIKKEGVDIIDSLASANVFPILQNIAFGRPFPRNDELAQDVLCSEILFEFLLCKELDCWEYIRLRDNSTLMTISSREIFQQFMSKYVQEFRYRDYLEAIRQVGAKLYSF